MTTARPGSSPTQDKILAGPNKHRFHPTSAISNPKGFATSTRRLPELHCQGQRGPWTLQITDFSSNDGTTNVPTQFVQSWSLNFTGRIATTTGVTPYRGGGTNNVQQVAINATGGTWILNWNGNVTAALPFDIDAATLQATIEAFPNVGVGNVTVTGGGQTPFVITFQNLLGGSPQNAFPTTGSALTGGAATATVTQIAAGSFGFVGGISGETGGTGGFGVDVPVINDLTGFWVRMLPGSPGNTIPDGNVSYPTGSCVATLSPVLPTPQANILGGHRQYTGFL